MGLTMDTDVAMGRDTIDIRELNQILSKDKRVLPKRIILVRHGESMGNVDETIYSRVPDPQIRLTDRGREQVRLHPPLRPRGRQTQGTAPAVRL